MLLLRFYKKGCFYLILFIVFVSCVNKIEDVNSTMADVEPGIERGKNIEMFYSEEADVKIKLKAPTITRYLTEKPYTEFNDGLQVDFFDDSMRITSKLTANYGIRYEKDLKTIVKNNVVVVNEKGETLNTDELIWDEKRHLIYSDKFVKIITKDNVIYGEGLEADERMNNYTIKKVQGTIKSSQND